MIKKINPNKAKHLLVENEFKKLQIFDSICFRGKLFGEDGAQNYLIFHQLYSYFRKD